jgi:membrane-bound lytic murein transglycosylase B
VAEFAEALGYKNQSVVPVDATSKPSSTKDNQDKSKTKSAKKSSAKKKSKST